MTKEDLWSDLGRARFEGNFKRAFEIIDKLKGKYPFMQEFLVADEVSLMIDMGKYSNALEAVNDALYGFPNSIRLLDHKSEIIYRLALQEININRATEGIQKAITIISDVINRRSVQRFEHLASKDRVELSDFHYSDTSQEELTRLYARRSDMSTMLKILLVQNQIRIVKNGVDRKIKIFNNEKIKQFEQLGLFSAIIALIITNVQIIPKLSIEKIFVFNVSLALVLLFIISGGSLLLEIGQNDSYFKRWKFWFYVSTILLLAITYLYAIK